MDESRDTPAEPETRPPAVVAATRLSPLQEAYGDYATHALRCPRCRDVDQRCDEAGRLWRAYWVKATEAVRGLTG
ncbi:hypothetical protein ACWD48_19395 [Streptomyces sp. NPDC002519]